MKKAKLMLPRIDGFTLALPREAVATDNASYF